MTATLSSPVDAVGSGDELRQQFLTFRLGHEEYAIDLLRVQEIRGYSPPTRLPDTPAYFEGVLNLRGSVVPVVNLRARFGMETIPPDAFTVVIMVNANGRVAGLLVDAVSDVLDLSPEARSAVPEFGGGVDTSLLEGIARSGDRLISLLTIERVLGFGEPGERAALDASGPEPPPAAGVPGA